MASDKVRVGDTVYYVSAVHGGRVYGKVTRINRTQDQVFAKWAGGNATKLPMPLWRCFKDKEAKDGA